MFAWDARFDLISARACSAPRSNAYGFGYVLPSRVKAQTRLFGSFLSTPIVDSNSRFAYDLRSYSLSRYSTAKFEIPLFIHTEAPMLSRSFELVIKELCEQILSEPFPEALPNRIINHIQKTFPVEWATLWLTEQKSASGEKRLRLAAATGKAVRLLTAEDNDQPAVYSLPLQV